MEGFFSLPLIGIGLVLLYLLNSVKILAEYERGVIFRLGRLLSRAKGPGLIFVFRPIDRMQRVSLRTVTMDVPPQDVITRDNVTVSVNAVVYFRVMDPRMAVTVVFPIPVQMFETLIGMREREKVEMPAPHPREALEVP